MLGESLSDPEGVEGGGTMKGMGLLPMDTVFAGEKTRTRVTGTFQEAGEVLGELSGEELEGYEIHMGQTVLKGEAKSLTAITDYGAQSRNQCKEDGAYRENVYGTYVHGIFDREGVSKAVIRAIGRKKGLDVSEITSVDFQKFKESQYDLLAEGLRKHLDMKKIYEILEEGI